MITIDGSNIKTTWKLEPMFENFHNSLMRFPSVKPRVTEDFEDEDGIGVLQSVAKLEQQDVSLSFICDTKNDYDTFISHLIDMKVVELRSSYISKVFNLEYISCSSFNNYNTFSTFGIKFRERNPALRTGLETFDLTFDNKFD